MNKPTKPIEQVVNEDGRYPIEAVQFVRQGLSYAVEKLFPQTEEDEDEIRHITGQQLCEALREFALRNWGSMALPVLNHWHIKTTRDFGEIVFLLVNSGWMQKQPTDSIEDFDHAYDFKSAFKNPFNPDLED